MQTRTYRRGWRVDQIGGANLSSTRSTPSPRTAHSCTSATTPSSDIKKPPTARKFPVESNPDQSPKRPPPEARARSTGQNAATGPQRAKRDGERRDGENRPRSAARMTPANKAGSQLAERRTRGAIGGRRGGRASLSARPVSRRRARASLS